MPRRRGRRGRRSIALSRAAGFVFMLGLPFFVDVVGLLLDPGDLLLLRAADVRCMSTPVVVATWTAASIAVRGLLQCAGPLRNRIWDSLLRWDWARLATVATTTGGIRLAERASAEEREERSIEDFWLASIWDDHSRHGTCWED